MPVEAYISEEEPAFDVSVLLTLLVEELQLVDTIIKEETINTIYKAMGDKEGLTEALIELYNEPINAMFDEPKDSEKKVVWKKG